MMIRLRIVLLFCGQAVGGPCIRVHKVMDHIENMNGIQLLLGTELCQLHDALAASGKGCGDRYRDPVFVHTLLSEDPICIKEPCGSARLIEHIPVGIVRSLLRRACIARVETLQLRRDPKGGFQKRNCFLRKSLRLRMQRQCLCEKGIRREQLIFFRVFRPGDQLGR